MRVTHLDVVRGLAALSVVMSHTAEYLTSAGTIVSFVVAPIVLFFTYSFWASGGLHPGVIVFIVLSGFCIHMPVAGNSELPARKGFWVVYWKRRLLRITPVFLFGCGLGVLALFITGRLPLEIGSAADYFVIVGKAVLLNAFAPVGGDPPGNEILQTVIAEIWLYATYPLTLGIYRRFGAKVLLAVSAVIHLVPTVFILLGADPTWAARSWYAFYLYWVLGMLAVEFLHSSERSVPLQWVVAAFFVYVALGNAVHFKGSHYPKSLLLAICTAMLLFAVSRREQLAVASRSVFWMSLVRLGGGSYTLYAVHVPLVSLWLAFAPGFLNLVPGQIGLVAFLFAATAASFFVVEAPSHRYAQSFRIQTNGLANKAS